MPERPVPSSSFRNRLVSTPALFPHWTLEPVLDACSALGFSLFEGFTEWATCRLDWRTDPAIARSLAEARGLRFSSFHLPSAKDDSDATIRDLITAARYAVGLGTRVVLFKAASRELYGSVGRKLLDSLAENAIAITPVLQNYHGGAIDTLSDFQDVLRRLDGDPRMKALLEVGQFQKSGIAWPDGWTAMDGRIELMHVNDIREGHSVLYGTGEVDFAGLMRRVKSSGYAGNIVVELELPTRETQPELTIAGVREAVAYLERLYDEA